MPKVLRIMNRLSVGGPIHHVGYLTRYLNDDYETLLLVGNFEKGESDGSYILERMGVAYTKIPSLERSLNPLKDIQAFRQLRKIIRDYKPDIVHTHAAKSGFLGRMAAVVEGVPVIVHTFHGHVFHSYFNKTVTSFFLIIEKYLAKKSSATIAISELQKNDLVNTYKIAPADKVPVIPLGFDLSRFAENQEENRELFRNKFYVEEDVLAIGIVGRLTKIKNQTMFLKVATQMLATSTKKLKFFIIGDGSDMEMLKNTCKNLGLRFSCRDTLHTIKYDYDVMFTSMIKRMEVGYAGLDILTLTSLNEGTPVTLIEGQASNKPIISTDVGAVRDAVLPGKTALLSPSNNEEAFCKNLLAVIENDDLRKKLSLEGGFIYKKFDYKRLINEMRTLYNQLLKMKNKVVLN